jgi:hypothetical protein
LSSTLCSLIVAIPENIDLSEVFIDEEKDKEGVNNIYQHKWVSQFRVYASFDSKITH